MYETWAFANVSSGKGKHFITEEQTNTVTTACNPASIGWQGTQVSAVVMRPGNLEHALSEVRSIPADIRAGLVPGVAREEFVKTAYIHAQIQIGLSGTGVGVNHACDRLHFKGIGTRAVNLPFSGPYHTLFIESANRAFAQLMEVFPLYEPTEDIRIVSSDDGRVLRNIDDIRDYMRVSRSGRCFNGHIQSRHSLIGA